MTTILQFPDQRPSVPHLCGKAYCIGCQHTWDAVAPVGTVWLECPKCKTPKGRLYEHVLHDLDH